MKREFFIYYWEWTDWHRFRVGPNGGVWKAYPTHKAAEMAILEYCKENPHHHRSWKIEESLVNPYCK